MPRRWRTYTAKTKYRNFETNIPRKGISGSQSQFLHSCVCEWFIYSHDWSAYSAGGNTVCRPILGIQYINRSQTHKCGNWGWGRAIPRKGIYKWDVRCRVDVSPTDVSLTESSKQIFPEKEYRGLSSNFHIHASVSDLYIFKMGLPILLEEIL